MLRGFIGIGETSNITANIAHGRHGRRSAQAGPGRDLLGEAYCRGLTACAFSLSMTGDRAGHQQPAD